MDANSMAPNGVSSPETESPDTTAAQSSAPLANGAQSTTPSNSPSPARPATARNSTNGGKAQGKLSLPPPVPWPDPVDGAALLDDIAETFRRHLILPRGAAEAIALWVVHTHS